MADRDLQIQIEIAELRETIAKLQEMVGATTRLGEATREHGKLTLETLEHVRGFRRVLEQITEQSPLAGLALHAAFSGPGAVIAGLVLALHALRKAQEEAKKAAEEHAEEVTKEFLAAEGSISRAVDEVYKAKVAHDDWLKSVTEGQPTIRQELDQTIAKLHVLADVQKEVAKAQGKPEEPITRQAEISEIAITQKAIETLKRQKDEALAAAQQADTAAIAGKATAGPIQESIQRQIEKEQREATEFDKKHAGEGPSLMQRFFGGLLARVPMLSMLSTGGGGMIGPGGEHTDEIKRLQNEAAKAATTQAELEKNAAKAQERFKALNDQLIETTKTLDMLMFKAGVGGVGRAATGAGDDAIANTLVRGAAGLHGQLSAFGLPSSFVNQNAVADLVRMLSALGKNNAEMIATIREHNGNFEAQARDIAALRAEAARLRAQQKGAFGP